MPIYETENDVLASLFEVVKAMLNYDENLKYQEINKYKESNDKEIKSNYDFGFYLDVNKEERTINSIKIDVGTNF